MNYFHKEIGGQSWPESKLFSRGNKVLETYLWWFMVYFWRQLKIAFGLNIVFFVWKKMLSFQRSNLVFFVHQTFGIGASKVSILLLSYGELRISVRVYHFRPKEALLSWFGDIWWVLGFNYKCWEWYVSWNIWLNFFLFFIYIYIWPKIILAEIL